MDYQQTNKPAKQKQGMIGVFLALAIAFAVFSLWDSGAMWGSILYQFKLIDTTLSEIVGLGSGYFSFYGGDLSLFDYLRAGFPGILLALFPIAACIAGSRGKKGLAITLSFVGLATSWFGLAAFGDFGTWVIIAWVLNIIAHLLLMIAMIDNQHGKIYGIILTAIGVLGIAFTIVLSFCTFEYNGFNTYKLTWVGTDFWKIDENNFWTPFLINIHKYTYRYGSTEYYYRFSNAASTIFPLCRGILFLAMGAGAMMLSPSANKQNMLNPSYEMKYPAYKIATNRSMAKLVLLGILTMGIYPTIISYYMLEDINLIASPHAGRRTMHPAAATLLGLVTCGIYFLIWEHQLCNRIQDELYRRNISYKFNASTFWGWGVLGSFILIGPFVFLHKYCNAMNYLAENYNQNG